MHGFVNCFRECILKKFVLLFLAIPMFVGCASITKGTTQTLIFNVEPMDARCVLSRDGDGEIGSVSSRNNTVTVGKDKDDIVVKCNALGYAQKTLRLVSSAETAGVVGGIFLDLGVTDLITGAMWSYPSNTTITLEKCEVEKKTC